MFSVSSSLGSFRSHCCWHGRRCFRSPWERLDARRCSASAMEPCSSWCRSIFPPKPEPSPAWLARWAAWVGSSLRYCLASSATPPARSGPGSSCSQPRRLVLWRVNARVFLAVPEEQGRSGEPGPSATSCRRLGNPVGGLLIAVHRGGLAKSGEFRPCAGDLHVRRCFRFLGRGLPLQCLDREATDPGLLGPGLANRSRAGPLVEPTRGSWH